MAEDIEAGVGTTEEVTTTEDSNYAEILAGEESTPSKIDSQESEDQTNLDQEQDPEPEVPEFDPEQEVTLEIGGKQFTLKGAEALAALENTAKFSERENELLEKEKSLNRDYTQKSQANAEFRKSIEENFGRFPESEELQALGKVWKAYFENDQARNAINSILQGGELNVDNSGQPHSESAQVQALQQELHNMQRQFQQFTSQLSASEQQKAQSESQQIWKSWADKMSESGNKISEEIDAKMAPFVAVLKQANPDMEPHAILDAAYKHATIDQIQNNAAKQVLVNADRAKKSNPPKINPKSAQKPDSEMSYAEIIQNAN